MLDIKQLTDEDIVSVIELTDTVRTKVLIADFFKYLLTNRRNHAILKSVIITIIT